MSGAQSEAWGRAAEEQAEAWYRARGATVAARRARTPSGELDLVLWLDQRLVFVEVKARRSLREALEAVTPRKGARLLAAASHFAAEREIVDTDMRFDVAVLDRAGRLEVLEDAIRAEDFLN